MRSPGPATVLSAASAAAVWCAVILSGQSAPAQGRQQGVTYPPKLPDGKQVVTDKTEAFLKPPATLKQETSQGYVYTVSQGDRGVDATLWALNTKTEGVEKLGTAAVASQGYVASLAADPSGRYVYYVPGAHGGSERDGAAVVQLDTRTRRKKVIAFLHPFYQERYGATLKGTYSVAVDPRGDKLYVTWNVSRGSPVWDCCALTVLHIPESERQP